MYLEYTKITSINNMTTCIAAPLVPFDDEEGSFFKVYLADTGIMFYKLAVNPRLWLDATASGSPDTPSAPVGSSDFRGALAENSVMQALVSNDIQTYYWTPPSSWKATGELDFLLQTDQMQVVPLEVKSTRNVRARTLDTFMERSGAPFAYLLSADDFGRDATCNGREVRQLPLYAAYCVGSEPETTFVQGEL